MVEPNGSAPSFIRRNLVREIPGWTFDQVKDDTRQQWNDALNAIRTDGGTERQRTIFYTALYRSLGRMTDITEDDHYFSGYDHAVHDAQGHHFYIDDGLWDTYRSLHPLQLLLDPHQQEDMIQLSEVVVAPAGSSFANENDSSRATTSRRFRPDGRCCTRSACRANACAGKS